MLRTCRARSSSPGRPVLSNMRWGKAECQTEQHCSMVFSRIATTRQVTECFTGVLEMADFAFTTLRPNLGMLHYFRHSIIGHLRVPQQPSTKHQLTECLMDAGSRLCFHNPAATARHVALPRHSITGDSRHPRAHQGGFQQQGPGPPLPAPCGALPSLSLCAGPLIRRQAQHWTYCSGAVYSASGMDDAANCNIKTRIAFGSVFSVDLPHKWLVCWTSVLASQH